MTSSIMAESERDKLLRTIEDFERTLTEFQSNNVVLATTVLQRRLEEIGVSATALGDPVLIAMIEKMRRQLTTGKGLDG
jgi:hypothetical protein